MKNVVSLWIILLLGLIAYSQDHKWYFNYNTGKSEIGHDIVCGDDGFVYVAGVEYNDLDHDIVVIALDKAGTRQWVYVYEGQQDIYSALPGMVHPAFCLVVVPREIPAQMTPACNFHLLLLLSHFQNGLKLLSVILRFRIRDDYLFCLQACKEY